MCLLVLVVVVVVNSLIIIIVLVVVVVVAGVPFRLVHINCFGILSHNFYATSSCRPSLLHS